MLRLEVGQMSKNRDRQRENRRKYQNGVSLKNAEGYMDKTAGAAINKVIKEGNKPCGGRCRENAKKG